MLKTFKIKPIIEYKKNWGRCCKMYVIPAVDIKNGKCVQLVQGKPGTEQIIIENPEVSSSRMGK